MPIRHLAGAVSLISLLLAGSTFAWERPVEVRVEYKPLESVIKFRSLNLDETSASFVTLEVNPESESTTELKVAEPALQPAVDTPITPEEQPTPALETQPAPEPAAAPEVTQADPVIVEGNAVTATVSTSLEDYPDAEILILVGTGNIEGIGNVRANRIIGNAGNNTIDGKGGADTLIGGPGDDTYVLAAAENDTIEDESGNDTITSTISRDLADFPGIENITLTFSAPADAIGDDNSNTLIGNAGVNTLDGRGGDDILDGGPGADTLIGGPGKDIFVLSDPDHSRTAAGHRDMITDFKSGEDRIDLSAIAPTPGFTFIGDAEFSGAVGELRWFKKNKDWIILEGDFDGDYQPEFQIEVAPVRKLTEADLILR